ncbi:MAG: hypothetical protein JWO19_5020 [Bryobacterales bacterium]|nr:hypothetical protein [Bryobacterales bacterium]
MNHSPSDPHLSPHLSDDELIGWLYGLGDAEGHLSGCSDCGERWNAMLRALGKERAHTVHTTEISGRTLAAQRQRILEQVERTSSGFHAWRWIPAAALASLVAVGLFLYQPSTAPQSGPSAPAGVNAETDAELFIDVYAMERDVEPRAAAPIRALFQEALFEPAAKESRTQ